MTDSTSELDKRMRIRVASDDSADGGHDAGMPEEIVHVQERLLDRAAFLLSLEQLMEQRRGGGAAFAVFLVSVDGFNAIRGGLTNEAGEDLFAQIAERIKQNIRSGHEGRGRTGDKVGRLAVDEFGILATNAANESGAIVIANRLNRVFQEPFCIGDRSIVISVSVGIALAQESMLAACELLGQADAAMYRAKQAGNAQHAIFSQNMQQESRRRLQIENALRCAMGSDDIQLCYQPIVNLETGRVSSFESLVRWHHKDFGNISPSEFIPLAEEVGLIVPLGAYVFKTACAQLRTWRREFANRPDLSMNINVSKRQLVSPGFLSAIRKEVTKQGLDPERINLEITESGVTCSPQDVLKVLSELRSMGFRLHMDDFGTGLSSLSSLHTYPVDLLKIDRSFIETMELRRDYTSVVYAIISLALNLNLKVTAEGIENTDQLAQVISLGCHYGQGYLFARPLSVGEATALLESGVDFQSHLPVNSAAD